MMIRAEAVPGKTLGDSIILVERSSPLLADHELRLKTIACSVNRTDLERLKGAYGGIPTRNTAFAPRGEGPYVPGLEPVGLVVEVGSAVGPEWLGRRVLVHSHRSCGQCSYCRAGLDNACGQMVVFGSQTPGYGGWSDEVVVRADQVVALPDGVSTEAAACLEVTYATVWWALTHHVRIVPGEVVAIRGGTGALAVAAVQIALLLGADPVVLVREPDGPKSQALVAAVGGKAIADTATPDQLLEVGGRLPSVVLELVGGHHLNHDVALVAPYGTVVVLGAHGGAEGSVRWDWVFHKSVAIRGSARAPLHSVGPLLQLFVSGRLRPIISKTFPLTSVTDAVLFADKPTGLGRVILRMT